MKNYSLVEKGLIGLGVFLFGVLILSPFRQVYANTITVPFITTWNVSSNGGTITIPTHAGDTYNYNVDWGDGSTDTGDTGNATHGYATAGVYTVSITGVFPRIYFNGGIQGSKILSIAQWGNNTWTSMVNAFESCNNLAITATDIPDLSAVTSTADMFEGDLNSTSFNANSWDVSNVTNMSGMFAGDPDFNENLDSWDVSHVTNMSGMFNADTNFNGNVDDWNTHNVTNMSSMFSGDQLFNQNIGNWDVSNVTNMSGMFSGAHVFDQNIGSWNVGKATTLNAMFDAALGFNQNIGLWNIVNVTNMANIFRADTLSTPNYDALLQGWSAEMVKHSLTFNGGSSTYCAVAAHATLTSSTGDNWTITDGGLCNNLLSISSTVKGQTVASLGTPSSVFGSETPGSVTITSAQALGFTGTTFVPIDSNVTITKVVKYASGQSDANFASDPSYDDTTDTITNNDYFVIEATVPGSSVVNYYLINVTVTPPPTTVPGSPTSPVAVAGNAQATVTFTIPASDGGSPITSYLVTSSPGAITATGSASPITVIGLTNGTSYTFTVTAINNVGPGTPSGPSNSVTPMAPASSVIINRVISGGGCAVNLGYVWDKTTMTCNPPVTAQPITQPKTISQVLGSGVCPSNLIITDNMRLGDRDGKSSIYTDKVISQVGILQTQINRILAASYNQAAGPIDGVFGHLTKQGVVRLQISLNTILKPVPLLKIDGIVGPFTRAAMNNSCGQE